MKFRPCILLLVCAAAMWAQTAGFTVVSAASYQGTIAPDSLASIFGTSLARATASATLDASGQLPTELAATRVEVNGQESRLIFVSPGQINFLVPAGISSGTAAVLVRSTDTGNIRTGVAQVASSAPAIFSSDASGGGPGAILNAVTYRPSPFVTSTVDNGADVRTRLAVYGTGFRHAKSVTAGATDAKGKRYDLVVEFAGAAPGFFGLDQLNFILPADLDGAGLVSLAIASEDATSNATSNTVTFEVNLLAATSLRLARLTLSPTFVNGGDSITANISLNGVARFAGFPVTLRSSNLAAQVTPIATIPEGKSSMDVTVTTSRVTVTQTGSILALAGDVTLSGDFEVDPATGAQLTSVSVTPVSTLGGRTLQGTVTLNGAAPAGGLNVQMASDNDALRPPSVVSMPFNQTSVNFSISTLRVDAEQNVTLAATFGRTTVSTKVKLLPLLTLSIDPAAVTGGVTATGSITLADPAPAGGVNILLATSDTVAARVPPFATVSVGQTVGTFDIITSSVASPRMVTLSASYTGITSRASLTVNPQPAPALSAVSVLPDHITGGQTAQGTVTLTAPAPAGGLVVNLSSTPPAVVAGLVVVPQGQTAVNFTINTNRVPSVQTVTITASAAGVSKTAVLTVQP